MSTDVRKVAFLTAGGLAPCLSSALGYLIERYHTMAPYVEQIAYINGYAGLLKGDSLSVTSEVRENCAVLQDFGGSPIGNSRVKLTNVKDCVKRGLVADGQDPLHAAAEQLTSDGVDVLHTIGGDDTNTAAADLAAFLKSNDYQLTVVGLPKTIDNDVYPIRQSLGAWTAAEQGARFFENVVSENNANPQMLIVHEIMGRNCGWLTAETARIYRDRLATMSYLPEIGLGRERRDIHGIYLPEMKFDIAAEAERLRHTMAQHDCVNLFISEGAGVKTILDEMIARGEKVTLDPFGHPRLDQVNPGQWFGQRFADMLGAEKTLVQKSGYFARSAPANDRDRDLIERCAHLAVDCALRRESGVVGEDDDCNDGTLSLIAFDRIKGGKPFDPNQTWFQNLLRDIGQTVFMKQST